MITDLDKATASLTRARNRLYAAQKDAQRYPGRRFTKMALENAKQAFEEACEFRAYCRRNQQ